LLLLLLLWRRLWQPRPRLWGLLLLLLNPLLLLLSRPAGRWAQRGWWPGGLLVWARQQAGSWRAY
jgi:hypothetical protein